MLFMLPIGPILLIACKPMLGYILLMSICATWAASICCGEYCPLANPGCELAGPHAMTTDETNGASCGSPLSML